MTNDWLPCAVLRAASLLAPGDQRAEWLEWWRSELWYIPRGLATLFCLGAFRDALWLRRNNPIPVKRPGMYPVSPLNCLAILATLAAASILVERCLEPMLPFPQAHGASALGGIAELAFFYLFLAAIALLIGDSPGSHRSTPWPSTLRGWIFLALKLMFVLPIVHCTFVALIVIRVPFLTLGFFVTFFLLSRWVFMDQRRRCPVCLRLLTKPVRVGTPSQTFLEWYGAESVCSRGHGMLHASGIPASYSGEAQWLTLDDSCRALFSEAAGTRQ